MDYGEEGLKEIIAQLDENGIAYTGAGMNLSEALRPMILNMEEHKIIIQNYGWNIEETVYATNKSAGCAPRKERIILEQIRKYKSIPDSILVNIYHWGFEYNLYPMPFDIDLAHKAIDVGCDLIIGHHPHNIQPKEKYKEKSIYYSLGNFYFGSMRGDFDKEFHGKITNLCDYGSMILYNTSTNNTQDFIIYYDRKSDKSLLLDEDSFAIEDITSLNYKNMNYINKVKANSFNVNPILTLNKFKNYVKISKLMFAYKMVALLRYTRRVSIGEKFYQIIRKAYKY